MKARRLQKVMALLFSFILLIGAGVSVNAAKNDSQPTPVPAASAATGAFTGTATGVTPAVADEKINIPLKVEWVSTFVSLFITPFSSVPRKHPCGLYFSMCCFWFPCIILSCLFFIRFFAVIKRLLEI